MGIKLIIAKHLLALMLPMIVIKVVGQTLSFSPNAFNIIMTSPDTTISINYTVLGMPYDATYFIILDSPKSSIPRPDGYTVLISSRIEVNGNNPAGKIPIKLSCYAGARDTMSLRIRGRLENSNTPATVLQDFRSNGPTILLDYGAPSAGGASTSNASQMLNLYREAIYSIDSGYNCKENDPAPKRPLRTSGRAVAVQSDVLDSNILNVFSNVIFGSADYITTGSAGSIVQDKTSGTVSFNNTFQPKIGEKATQAWNLGISAKSSGSFYDLFSGNSWRKEFGLNGGITIAIHNGTQNFDTEPCEKLRDKRDVYYQQLLSSYTTILSEPIDALRRRLASLNNLLNYRNRTMLSDKEFQGFATEYQNLEKRIADYDRIYTNVFIGNIVQPDSIQKVITADVNKFDRQNDILTGYRIWWLDLKGGVSYVDTKFDTATASVKDRKRLSDKGIPKIFVQVNGNLTGVTDYKPMSKGKLYFAQVSLLLERGSFLDVLGMVGKPKFDTSETNNPKIVNADNGEAIGLYQSLNKPVWSFMPSGYGALLFGKGQQFGWDFRMAYRRIFQQPVGSSLKDTYSFFTGPVFRLAAEKDFTKASIGLKTGFTDAPIHTDRLWKDFFTVRLEIGVPFKWYYKPKS